MHSWASTAQSSPFKEWGRFHRGDRTIFEGFFVILWHYLPSEKFSPSEIKMMRPSLYSCNCKSSDHKIVISQDFTLNIFLFVLFCFVLHNLLILSFRFEGIKFLGPLGYRENLGNISFSDLSNHRFIEMPHTSYV